MNLKHHLMAAWGGVAFVVLFGIGWALIGGYVPPPAPSASAEEIASFYRGDTTAIRIGLLIVMLGIAPMLPFMAALTMQMWRMEGRWPVLALSNATLGVVNVMLFLLPVVLWMSVAFRPERDAEMMRMVNDLGWLFILWPFSTAALQNVALGLAVLGDRNPQRPVFPRWTGWFNFWVALILIPGGLLPFFKSGPFAWNGILAFWLPAGIYLVWMLVMTAVLIKAIRLQANE